MKNQLLPVKHKNSLKKLFILFLIVTIIIMWFVIIYYNQTS